MLLASILRVTAISIMIFVLAGPCLAESGVLLKQYSARYGSITCMATNQNFRMDASELRVFLRPPFKHMDMYNMSSKAHFTCDIGLIGKDTDWRLMSANEKKAGAREEIISKGVDMLQQYKLDRYLINLQFRQKPDRSRQDRPGQEKSRPDKPKLDFWTTKEKDFPQRLNAACCTLTGLPEGYGFPVKMYQYQEKVDRSGKLYRVHFKVLDTTKVTRQTFPHHICPA